MPFFYRLCSNWKRRNERKLEAEWWIFVGEVGIESDETTVHRSPRSLGSGTTVPQWSIAAWCLYSTIFCLALIWGIVSSHPPPYWYYAMRISFARQLSLWAVQDVLHVMFSYDSYDSYADSNLIFCRVLEALCLSINLTPTGLDTRPMMGETSSTMKESDSHSYSLHSLCITIVIQWNFAPGSGWA